MYQSVVKSFVRCIIIFFIQWAFFEEHLKNKFVYLSISEKYNNVHKSASRIIQNSFESLWHAGVDFCGTQIWHLCEYVHLHECECVLPTRTQWKLAIQWKMCCVCNSFVILYAVWRKQSIQLCGVLLWFIR